MSISCPIITEKNLENAMNLMHKEFKDDFMELFKDCPTEGGGRRRRLKGGVNARTVRFVIYIVITFLIGANLWQTREAIMTGLSEIADGTCNGVFSRWSYLQNPICSFWIGFVDSVTQALRGNIVIIGAIFAIIRRMIRSPGDIYEIIEPFSEYVASVINGPEPLPPILDEVPALRNIMTKEEIEAAQTLVDLSNAHPESLMLENGRPGGPAGGKRRKRTRRMGGRKSTKGKMCGGKKRRSMRRKRTRRY